VDAAGANATLALLDAHVAAGRGDRPALVTGAGTTTYGRLLDLASRAGVALRALGVEPEQRVALLLPDGLPWVWACLGAWRIGAVTVPLNTRLAPPAWRTILEDCAASILVTEPDLAAPLLAPPGLPAGLRVVAPEALVADSADLTAPAAVGADAMALWLYTSGTTGAPKAAVHTHRHLLAGLHYGVGVLGASPEDRFLVTSKLFFAYALGNALLIPLQLGAQSFLEPAWADPAGLEANLRRFRPTLVFSVPTFYARLLAADLSRASFASVRHAVSAGERLPEDISRGVQARYDVEILDGMGATETIFMALSNRPGRSRPGSSGVSVPGTEARVLDAEGGEAPPGVEGVLHVRMPSASTHYWNRPEQSRRAFAGGWFCTGDVYVRDADGFYHHRGREDDRFKVAGMWVAPADVEAAICAHPEVMDAGVVGLPDEHGLVKAVAFVVAKTTPAPGRLVEALTRLAAQTLPAHQRPRRIEVVPELPRTATGKLQRFVLRAGPS
jgi:benzoate-CoA ligase family protein